MPQGVLAVSYSSFMVSNEHLHLTDDMFYPVFQFKVLWDMCMFDLNCVFPGNPRQVGSRLARGAAPCGESCAPLESEIAVLPASC